MSTKSTPPSTALTGPDAHLSLGALLRRPYEALSEQVYGRLADEGFPDLRPAHSAVFRLLPQSGGRVADLARAAGMTKQSMAYLVENLSSTGYLQTVPDPVDGRARLVCYTPRGTEALHTLLRLSTDFEQQLARLLDEGDAAQLRTLLEKLYHRLEPHA